MLHESAHGLDMGRGTPFMSANPTFIDARNLDLNSLSSYERQPSPAGEEETFAESAARFYMEQDAGFPHLHGYWTSIAAQLAVAAALMAARPAGRHQPPDTPGATIGSASMTADGTITLQLRATRDGARGDALLIYRPDHPHYDYILQHLDGIQPNESKHVRRFPRFRISGSRPLKNTVPNCDMNRHSPPSGLFRRFLRLTEYPLLQCS
jgi:hypothetical protein